MKRIFFEARYVHQAYSKSWGNKESVYSRTLQEMTKLFQRTMATSGEAEETSGGGVKRWKSSGAKEKGDRDGMKSGKNSGEKSKTIGENRSDKDVASEKSKVWADRENSDKAGMGEKMDPVRKDVKEDPVRKDVKEVPAKKDLPAPATTPTSSALMSSTADLFFGSHFLATAIPIMHSAATNTLANVQPPSGMSLQQKLAAKQNQSGTKAVKPLNATQTHGVSLVNRPNLSITSEPAKSTPSSISATTIRTLPEPGKLPGVPRPVNVTINPTAYMSKMKKEVLKQIQKSDVSKVKPLVNIKPLQRPPHFIENKSTKPSAEPKLSSTKPDTEQKPSNSKQGTELAGLKLPKSVSLTKVQGNVPRAESPKPKPASITKVTEPPKAASPKLIDLTAPEVPKAIGASKVHSQKAVKIKKLQRERALDDKKISKKQLGPKSKIKDTPSTSASTSLLKNFRKPKEGKEKNEIIMIELD